MKQLNKMNKTTLFVGKCSFLLSDIYCIITNLTLFKSLHNRRNIDLSIFYQPPPKNEQNELYDS